MRSIEFITEITLSNTEGLKCSDWVELLECQETTLIESLEKSSVDYLTSLISYSEKGIVGNRYMPVFILLFPNGRISAYGIEQLSELIDIRDEDGLTVYEFKKNGGRDSYPFTRLSEKSFAQLYLFSNEDKFNEFRTAIAIKFSEQIFEADFS